MHTKFQWPFQHVVVSSLMRIIHKIPSQETMVLLGVSTRFVKYYLGRSSIRILLPQGPINFFQQEEEREKERKERGDGEQKPNLKH